MKNKKSMLMRAALTCLALWAVVFLGGCGGGFGADSANADDAALGIFGKDSTKK